MFSNENVNIHQRAVRTSEGHRRKPVTHMNGFEKMRSDTGNPIATMLTIDGSNGLLQNTDGLATRKDSATYYTSCFANKRKSAAGGRMPVNLKVEGF